MSASPSNKPAQLKSRFRITLHGEIALGPGKVDLLEAIGRTGSISAAARELGLSYRRAWGMVDTMNQCFKKPLVEGSQGGAGGGGAQLTALGQSVIDQYRAMETKAMKSVQAEWKALHKHLDTK
ncbi:winged helix-turn-helix domain-containing protein [Nitrospina watsonii]|uniref:Molybdenum-binding transcriptional regulator n=1 Tax=Nitrospina watsonii TaxID=1323948 RepID=A0ABM9HBC6_9BACT|nr:LysR family transcriptional regulator [Nitrospina watsonii]CAI2717422.1 Molybdenum-binding transcriptional regulator [Nitrospina watsonii]